MSILRKPKWLWLPVLAMLASASVTSKYIESNTRLTDQSGQLKMQQVLSAAAPVKKTAIWVRMRSGFDFPAVEQDAVRHYIDEYVKHPHLFEQLLQRGKPYLFHILNRIEQSGMPAELALLPVIESAFDPFATSPAGAAGIWQFMPETADYLGLNQDGWYDGRRDVIDSTEAALGYLKQLNKRFDGDWLLTLAAYNAGGARVQRAIRHNRDAGKPVDFWHLTLPAETRSYVPKLIALRTIIENPHDYNISLPRLLDTRYFSTVNIQGQLELKVAARLSGIPLHELQDLNPGYGLSITPPDRMNTLLVPSAAANEFRIHIARLPRDQRVQPIRHRIRLGDNLSTIAQQYRTTVSDIRKVNRLKGNKIIAGNLLIIPVMEHGDSIAASTYTTLM